MGMPWFKHYNTAHNGHLLGNLLSEQDYAAVAVWWALLENMSRFGSKETPGFLLLSLSRFSGEVYMKPSRCLKVLQKIASVSHQDLEVEVEEKQRGYLQVRLRNWSKLQETRGGLRLQKKDKNPGEVRSKIIEVRSKIKEVKIQEAQSALPTTSNPEHAASPAAPTGVPIFIGKYVEVFQKRYGKNSRPDLSPKVQGEIRKFLVGVPPGRACQLVEVYLQMDDKWFLTKCHDFTTFAANLSKIGVALDTGKQDPSKKESNWEYIFGSKGVAVV